MFDELSPVEPPRRARKALRTGAMFAVAVMAVAAGLGGCAAETTRSAGGAQQAPQAPAVKRVVFIGDSITGGWGFGRDNNPVLDNIVSLANCAQDPPPMNACTNDQPGAARTPTENPGYPPWISYPFQFANLMRNVDPKIEVSDYAVSGATPAMWDPSVSNTRSGKYLKRDYENVSYDCNTEAPDMALLDRNNPKWDSCDPNLFPGLYGTTKQSPVVQWQLSSLPDDGQTMSVFTLGANPIMSRFLAFNLANVTGVAGADNGCARWSDPEMRACVSRNIKIFRVVEHLTNILSYLADRGPVLAQKIYNACPGFFGRLGSSYSGFTSSHADCQSQRIMGNAWLATDMLNDAMDQAVANARNQKPGRMIAAICPGNVTAGNGQCGGPGTFDDHQQTENTKKYGGSFPANNPWILSTDSGIHPNASGHRFLAAGVAKGACSNFNLFCGALRNPNQWWDVRDKSCASGYYCAFASVRNDTSQAWTLAGLSQDSEEPTEADAGEWILFPPQRVEPGEFARFAIQSRHTGAATGAKGRAIYRINDRATQLKIETLVGVFSNSWSLESADRSYDAQILGNQSKNKGSEIILNGVVRKS